jgi:glycosyltransferase involved in cell wall biosynthesis
MKIGFFGAGIFLGTGYGQGIYNIARGMMARGHEVLQYAMQYSGFPITINGIKVYAGSSINDLRRSILETKPDFVVMYGDLWIYTKYTTITYPGIVKIAHEAGAKMVNWSPLHAVPVVKEFEDAISGEGDFCLFTTKWASDYFRSRGHDNVDYLYHPVSDDFHPVEILKRPFNLPNTGTMIMHVGYALDQRKMTPLLLLLLKKYLEHDPGAFEYLHTQVRSYFANDVFIQGLGIPKEKVIFSPYNDSLSTIHGLTVKDMNNLYNSANVYVNLSSAEGFDVPAVEAGSVGIPLVVTDSPVHREVLSSYNARYVRVAGLIPQPLQWESLADVDDALDKVIDVLTPPHKNPNARIDDRFRIPNVAERLENILGSI